MIWPNIFISSSEIFGKLRKSLENVRKCLFGLWTNFGESLENYLRKVVLEVFGKSPKCCCVLWEFYTIKRKLHGHLEIQVSLDVWKNISLIHCTHSWNIFQHLKVNFISPRSHVMSSTYDNFHDLLLKICTATWNLSFFM